MEKGYEEIVKVQQITLRLVEKSRNINQVSEINLSLAEGSSNAGKVASRVLRTLLVDEKGCTLNFVLNPNNKEEMCEKVVATQRIMRRMLRDPGNIIHPSLPIDVRYEVVAYAPVIKKFWTKRQELKYLFIKLFLKQDKKFQKGVNYGRKY